MPEGSETITGKRATFGVDYSPRMKGVCPNCGQRGVSAYSTMPWDGATRTRYHRCPNPKCKATFKSIEVDETWSQDEASQTHP